MPATQPSPLSVIGKAQPRVDGPLKVSGKAMYTSDHHFPGMVYAVPVCATIANGEAQEIDASAAEKMPGVRAIFVRNNIGKLFRASEGVAFDAQMSHVDETRTPLEDDVIRYYGQYVGLAVADTFEQATAAANAVKVTYRSRQPNVEERLAQETNPKVESERGDAEKVFGAASIQVDQTYDLPPETHNPIELHASSVAVWDGTAFTLYQTTQGVVNHRNVLARCWACRTTKSGSSRNSWARVSGASSFPGPSRRSRRQPRGNLASP
jgi:xanthine dehydrogenase YagR molybdenum-binding subunit